MKLNQILMLVVLSILPLIVNATICIQNRNLKGGATFNFITQQSTSETIVQPGQTVGIKFFSGMEIQMFQVLNNVITYVTMLTPNADGIRYYFYTSNGKAFWDVQANSC